MLQIAGNHKRMCLQTEGLDLPDQRSFWVSRVWQKDLSRARTATDGVMCWHAVLADHEMAVMSWKHIDASCFQKESETRMNSIS